MKKSMIVTIVVTLISFICSHAMAQIRLSDWCESPTKAGNLSSSRAVSEAQGNYIEVEFAKMGELLIIGENLLNEETIGYLNKNTVDYKGADLPSWLRFRKDFPGIFVCEPFALTSEEFDEETLVQFKDLEIAYGQNLDFETIIPRLNRGIENKLGIPDAISIEEGTEFVLTTITSLNAKWDYSFETTTREWNGSEETPFVKGSAAIAETKGPHGENITHIKAGDVVTFSVVRLSDLKDGYVGEWITDGIYDAEYSIRRVELPKLHIESQKDYKNDANYSPFFSPLTQYKFLKGKKISAFGWMVKTIFDLNEDGVSVKSVSTFVGGTRGLSPVSDFIFDEPFVLVVSLRNENSEPMRVFWVRVEDPTK